MDHAQSNNRHHRRFTTALSAVVVVLRGVHARVEHLDHVGGEGSGDGDLHRLVGADADHQVRNVLVHVDGDDATIVVGQQEEIARRIADLGANGKYQ